MKIIMLLIVCVMLAGCPQVRKNAQCTATDWGALRLPMIAPLPTDPPDRIAALLQWAKWQHAATLRCLPPNDGGERRAD